MPRKNHPSDAALKELRAFGLRYPGAHTKSPWPGHGEIPVEMLRSWIDESYRAQAPKKLVKTLDASGASPAPAAPALKPKPKPGRKAGR